MTNKDKELKFPNIKTKRLNLREFRKEDVNSAFIYLSDEETMEHYDVDCMTELESASEMIANNMNGYRQKCGIRWGIELSESKELIGDIGFNFDAWNSKADIGYILRRDYWRQGIISEALEAVIKWAFEELSIFKLNRIEGETTLDNSASMNTLKKIGFIEEGILREGRNWKNKLTDCRLFSCLRKDFEDRS